MEIAVLNSKVEIQTRAGAGQLTWRWPLALVLARLILAVAAQSLVAGLFFRSAAAPYLAAGRWWPVYGALIDLGCLGLLVWRARQEGLRFRDLINFDPRRLGRDVLVGLAYSLWFFPLALAGLMGASWLIYGSPQPPPAYSALPAWAALYSLLVFPALWALMEQATYQGYALPRLEALWKRPGLAVAVVALGWGLQHIALPLTFDVRFMAFRCLSFLPLAVVCALVYLRTRRLVPFIVAHWAVDMVGILTGLILPLLMK